MKNVFFGLLAGTVLLVGCTKELEEQNQQFQAKIDSLESSLENQQYAMELLDQVGLYMDSIDANRKWIMIDLETGLSEDDYIARMKSINVYTQQAEWTIGELEKTRSAYASQVKRLKKSIEEKDGEIKSLQLTVAEYQNQNASLQNLLTVSENDLMMVRMDLGYATDELEEKTSEVQDLLSKLVATEAETYFAKGEGYEMTANRIDFAPRRKKEALETALENYERALSLGHQPAAEKITSLKERLKITE